MEHRKLDALMTPVERIARVAAAGVNLAKAPQTAPSGAISLDNADGTRTIIGEVVNGEDNPSYTMATHVGDTTPPGVPTGIAATSKSGVVVVEWDGTLSGGIPDDFFCVRVYLDGAELGALTEAGSVASAKLDGGTTVLVTATSEDDCCLPDGTPDHNVSAASQAISITVTSSAAEVIVDVEEEIDGVRQEIADFKTEVEADYYTAEEVDEQTQAITREVGAVYRDSMARNLSPFYSHDFTDVYDAENPEGYWTQIYANATQLEDGWAHIVMDNSSGSGTMYAYMRVAPDAAPAVEGTMLVEVRNLVADVTTVEGHKLWWNPNSNNAARQVYGDGSQWWTEDGAKYFPIHPTNSTTADMWGNMWFGINKGHRAEFDARLSYYEGEYDGKYKQFNADTANLTRDYATKTWTKQTAEDYSIGAAQKYTATIANPNLSPFFAHDFLDIYNATTNPGGWWRGSVQRDFATQLQDGWARVIIDNTSGTALLARAFRFGASPDLKDGGKYTCLVEMRNILSKPTSATIYTQQGTDVQFWGDYRYDGWTVYWEQVEGDAHVEYKQMKRVEAVSRQTTGVVCFSMNVQVPAGQKADFEIRLSLFENATDSEGETITYDGPYKPYVTDQQALSKEYATQSQLSVSINGIRTEVSQTYETQSHANTTYSTKTELQQTASGLDTRITANATNIEGEILARETLIRQYANGVLVCKVGESVGALVNASGSFDVVAVSWSGNNPTVTGTLSTFMQNLIELGKGNTSAEIQFCDNTGNISVKPNYKGNQAIAMGADNTTIQADEDVYVAAGTEWGQYALVSELSKMVELHAATSSTQMGNVRVSSSGIGIDYQSGLATGAGISMNDITPASGGPYPHVEITSSGDISLNAGRGVTILGPNYDGTPMRGVFFGTKILNPNNSATMTLFTAAECQSMFGRALDQTKDVVIVQNGDTGAYQGQITGATNASGALMASINPTKSGPIRYQYLVILGA